MQKIQINIEIKQFHSVEELTEVQADLIKKAKNIVKSAYAPYSQFKVGAAALLENGEIVCGTNQENSVYPSGLCAERVTLFYASSKYPTIPVKKLAICAFYNGKYVETPIQPCGSCRQVMLETENRYNTPMELILYGTDKIFLIEQAKDLLPISFSNKNFK